MNLVKLHGENKTAEAHASPDLQSIHKMLAQLIIDSPAADDLSEWEHDFIKSTLDWPHPMSTKQWSILGRIAGQIGQRERRLLRKEGAL